MNHVLPLAMDQIVVYCMFHGYDLEIWETVTSIS